MSLVKRDKGLVLRIRPEYMDSPEMQEIAEIFRLRRGLNSYRIRSELSENVLGGQPRALAEHDTIYINMRSLLQIMIFLSKGVSIPAAHIESGVAPLAPGPDGQFHDWTRVTEGVFRVHVQKHCPKRAEISVPYRGYWYFVPEEDVNSRAVLAILEILFALEETERGPGGPLLALPLGG
jgi:hypothetical protein